MPDDRDGYLDAFGVPVLIAGEPYVGILDDDYQASEVGIATNALQLVLKTPDVTASGLTRGDPLQVWDVETSAWLDYVARTPEPRTDGFTAVPLSEAT